MGDQDGLIVCEDDLIECVIGIAIKVHTILGSGLLESVYEPASMFEFAEAKLPAQRQVEIPVICRGRDLGVSFYYCR